MKKVIAVVILALSFSGCAAFGTIVPLLNDVAAVIEDGARILDVIRSVESAYFAMQPNPKAQKKIEESLVAANLALDAVIRAANGARSVEEQDYVAALESFKKAYSELESALKEIGIVSASGKMGGPKGGEMQFPKPLALSR